MFAYENLFCQFQNANAPKVNWEEKKKFFLGVLLSFLLFYPGKKEEKAERKKSRGRLSRGLEITRRLRRQSLRATSPPSSF